MPVTLLWLLLWCCGTGRTVVAARHAHHISVVRGAGAQQTGSDWGTVDRKKAVDARWQEDGRFGWWCLVPPSAGFAVEEIDEIGRNRGGEPATH